MVDQLLLWELSESCFFSVYEARDSNAGVVVSRAALLGT